MNRCTERVLDVACGTGVVARLAAGRVGRDGAVTGVDINAGMLSVARAVAAAAGLDIRWYETSAESMPLPDASFDVAFCQLGLQFVADKPAALREIHRLLAPGGRALVSTPQPTSFFSELDDVLSRHASEQAGGFVRMVFGLNDPREVERLFREAGFSEVVVRVDHKSLRLPPARDFFWQYIHCTPLTGLLSDLDDTRLAAIERDIVNGWQPWSRDGGMEYEQSMVVATARE